MSEAPAPQTRAVLQDNGVALTLHAYSAPDGPPDALRPCPACGRAGSHQEPTVVALTADAAEDLGIELIRAAMRQRRRERNHIAGARRDV